MNEWIAPEVYIYKYMFMNVYVYKYMRKTRNNKADLDVHNVHTM